MGPYILPTVRRRLWCFPSRNPQQQIDQIKPGEKCAHRFDQPRVAVDEEVSARLRHDDVDRQCAVPAEPFPDSCEISPHPSSPHALLDRFATASASGNLTVSMKAEQFAARKYRLG